MVFPKWDTDLLVWINAHHTDFLDQWMWHISDSKTWIALYIVLALIFFLLYRHDKIGRIPVWFIAIVAVGAAAGLADFVSSGLIKHWVCRPRPTREEALSGILHIVNGYTGGRYGFVSSHAANTFAVATTFSLLYAKREKALYAIVPLLLWATLNCYSRMYLGVHYPLDILGGTLVGIAIATLIAWLTNRYVINPLPAKKEETSNKAVSFINRWGISILLVFLLSLYFV